MTEKRNLTVSLDLDVISRAKILAARQGTSVSRLIARLIEDLVDRERAYEIAMRGALGHLDTGYHLGGEIPVSWEEWHDR